MSLPLHAKQKYQFEKYNTYDSVFDYFGFIKFIIGYGYIVFRRKKNGQSFEFVIKFLKRNSN